MRNPKPQLQAAPPIVGDKKSVETNQRVALSLQLILFRAFKINQKKLTPYTVYRTVYVTQ